MTLTKSSTYFNILTFCVCLFYLGAASYFYYQTQMDNESTNESKSEQIKTALNVTEYKRFLCKQLYIEHCVVIIADLLRAPLAAQSAPHHSSDTLSSYRPRSAVARRLSDLRNRHRVSWKVCHILWSPPVSMLLQTKSSNNSVWGNNLLKNHPMPWSTNKYHLIFNQINDMY